jgi:hypothetical protein
MTGCIDMAILSFWACLVGLNFEIKFALCLFFCKLSANIQQAQTKSHQTCRVNIVKNKYLVLCKLNTNFFSGFALSSIFEISRNAMSFV